MKLLCYKCKKEIDGRSYILKVKNKCVRVCSTCKMISKLRGEKK